MKSAIFMVYLLSVGALIVMLGSAGTAHDRFKFSNCTYFGKTGHMSEPVWICRDGRLYVR